MNQSNIRLRSSDNGDGGATYIDPSDTKRLAKFLRDLDEYRNTEPNSGWYIQTQGTLLSWHRADEAQLRLIAGVR